MGRAERLFFLLLLTTLLVPTRAAAMGALVIKEGDTAQATRERIAIAAAPGRTTVWAQPNVEAAQSEYVWLVPLRPGARVDLASDAWLDALDAATSPIILPPTAAPPCDTRLAPEQLAPFASPSSAAPLDASVVTDLASLESTLGSRGLVMSAAVKSAVEGALSAGLSIAALRYEATELPPRTIRIVDSGPAVLPLSMTAAWPHDVRVTAFAIGSTGATAGTISATIDPAGIAWTGSGSSTYGAAVDGSLSDGAWLTESASPGLLFTGEDAGAGAGVPALLDQYFALARAYGTTSSAAPACVSAFETQDASAIPEACPLGALATAPGAALCVPADAGESPDALACGGAQDAELALAELALASVWVTRLEGNVTKAMSGDVPLTFAATAPLSPIVTASHYDATCTAPPAPAPTPASAPAPAPAPSPAPAPTSSTSDSNANDVAPAAEGCAAVLESCSNSDGSDSGDSGGCGSSSDPHSDSNDSGGGCGGGGSSSDSSNGSCTTRRSTRSRSPVSRILLVGAALAAVARRRGRPRASA